MDTLKLNYKKYKKDSNKNVAFVIVQDKTCKSLHVCIFFVTNVLNNKLLIRKFRNNSRKV